MMRFAIDGTVWIRGNLSVGHVFQLLKLYCEQCSLSQTSNYGVAHMDIPMPSFLIPGLCPASCPPGLEERDAHMHTHACLFWSQNLYA